jgi:amidohydrolase
MNMDLLKIQGEIDKIIPEITKIRQHIHRHPELSLKEYETSAFIRDKLKSLNIEVLPPFLTTDVVAMLNREKSGTNITLRADTDALPIREQNDHAYCSVKDNVMHACGHDGHTAMLIGAAIILERFKEQLSGSVRFVFQPGEEIVAAGKDLVKAGLLDSPKPGAVLALHAWPGYPLGAICSRPGAMMAAADIFKVMIKGKGGHGSTPEQTNDPVLTATRIINTLYLLPSRKFSALDSLVISICKLRAGTNPNIIPDEVAMEGTVRYFSKSVGKKILPLFEKAIKDECRSSGTTYTLKYDRPYIATINDFEVVKNCKEHVRHLLGKTSWIDLPAPVMAAEDFSFYLDAYPGAMFFLGMGKGSPKLHTNSFNFNDKALRNGILFLVLSTFGLLNK